MPKRGAINFTGYHSEQVDQRQTDRASDRRIRPVAVGEDVMRGIHADEGPDWTVHNNERRCSTRAGGGRMKVVFLVAHRTEDCKNNRRIGRQAARKHSIDGRLLRSNRPLADALDADDVARRQAGRIQTFTDALFRRRNNGKAVSPSLCLIKLVRRESVE